MVDHHKQKYPEKILDCCVRGQGHSEGENYKVPNHRTDTDPQTVSSLLNFIRRCTIHDSYFPVLLFLSSSGLLFLLLFVCLSSALASVCYNNFFLSKTHVKMSYSQQQCCFCICVVSLQFVFVGECIYLVLFHTTQLSKHCSGVFVCFVFVSMTNLFGEVSVSTLFFSTQHSCRNIVVVFLFVLFLYP